MAFSIELVAFSFMSGGILVLQLCNNCLYWGFISFSYGSRSTTLAVISASILGCVMGSCEKELLHNSCESCAPAHDLNKMGVVICGN